MEEGLGCNMVCSAHQPEIILAQFLCIQVDVCDNLNTALPHDRVIGAGGEIEQHLVCTGYEGVSWPIVEPIDCAARNQPREGQGT